MIVIDPERYENVTFMRVVCYEANGYTVRFEPVAGAPGFPYRVRVFHGEELIGKDWSAKQPSHGVAEFFYNKLVHGVYRR